VKKIEVPFSCPICGRKTEYPSEDLIEGAVLTCSFCKLKLTLHGHMLEDVQKEVKKLKQLSTGKIPSKKGCEDCAD